MKPLCFNVELSLCSELAAEVLSDVCRRAVEGPEEAGEGQVVPRLVISPGDVDHVDDDGLDAIPLALHLRLQAGHLVTVERILGGWC